MADNPFARFAAPAESPRDNVAEPANPFAQFANAPAATQVAPALALARPNEIPFGRRVIEFVRPSVEAGASIAGGAAGALGGALAGPIGTVTGAVLGSGGGYALGKGALDVLETKLGYREGPKTTAEAFYEPAKDVAVGATMEAFGRGVLGPAAGKAVEYYNRLRNLKADTYLKAMDGKGNDIVDALRQRPAVAGAAPTAGELAAPVGSAPFAQLQAQAKQVPEVASTYARMAAQTNEARLAQQARVDERFKAAADRLINKIDSNLTSVSQREIGQTLIDAAKAERQAVKTAVTGPAYDRAFAAAGQTKIDVANVVDKAEDILGRPLSSFDPSTAPTTVRKLAGIDPLKGLTLEQLDDIRKAVNADVALAARSSDPAAAQTFRNMEQLHKTIDDAVKTSATLPDEAKTLYQQALDTYRTQYAPRFKTGVNANLFRQTALNEPKLNPDDVIKTFFQPKGEREAQQFVTMFGQNADAMRVARTGIEDLYRREVVDAAGRVTPEAHAKFVKKYADPLRILDDAGMNLSARLDVVARDADRLAQINELAKASGNKLAPPLPPGANALEVQKRIDSLTANLTPQQKSHIDAVRQDMLRELEFERLVKAAGEPNVKLRRLGTETGRELGLPLPSFLSTPITIFNNVFRRLALRLDDKVALEIAREMTNPAQLANTLEGVLASRLTAGQYKEIPKAAGRAVSLGVGGEMARRSRPENALAPEAESQNALAR